MTQKKHLMTMLVLFGTSISFAQNLEQHEWKDRVLIVTATSTKLVEQQIGLLSKDLKGLKERKLVVYKVNPNQYTKGIDSQNWVANQTLYSKLKQTQKDFEVILIGLDGGVKLRQTELLSLEKLFALIDGMPMRRAEIKRNK
jgi:hypothetical protein